MVDQQKDCRWWSAVRTVAQLLMREGWTINDEGVIKEELKFAGYNEKEITAALNWIDQASLTGHLDEIFGMLTPEVNGQRIEHPIERLCLADGLWNRIEFCRQKGIFSLDIAERLLEGIRSVDIRDFDEEEISILVSDVLTSTGAEKACERFDLVVRGELPSIYS